MVGLRTLRVLVPPYINNPGAGRLPASFDGYFAAARAAS